MERWSFDKYAAALRDIGALSLADYCVACARSVTMGTSSRRRVLFPPVPELEPHLRETISAWFATRGVEIKYDFDEDEDDGWWLYWGPYGASTPPSIPSLAHAAVLAIWDEAAPNHVWTVRPMRRSEETTVYYIADGHSGVYDTVTGRFQPLQPTTMLVLRKLPFKVEDVTPSDLNDTLVGFALMVGPVILAMHDFSMDDNMSAATFAPLLHILQEQHEQLVGWRPELSGEQAAWTNAGFVPGAADPLLYLWNYPEADALRALDRLGITLIGKRLVADFERARREFPGKDQD